MSSKSKSSTPWTCCGMKRRNITNKFMAVFFQVIVVVVVWFAIKIQQKNAICDHTASAKSSDEVKPLCQPDQFTKGARLRLQDIVSPQTLSKIFKTPPGRNLLQVDIFVHDLDRQTMVMYPKGTPFILVDEYPTKENGINDSGSKLGNSAVDGDPSRSTNVVHQQNVNGLQESNQVNDKTMGSNALATYASSHMPQNPDNLFPNAQGGNAQNGQQNVNNMVSEQRANSIQVQDINQDNKGLQNQQNIVVENNIPRQEYHMAVEQTTPHDGGYYNERGTSVVSGNEEPLYASGFKDRVHMFMSEFYGKPMQSQSLPSNTQFLINNITACANRNHVDLLLLIHSQPQSDEQRQRIRTTFVQKDLCSPFSVVYIFLLGTTSSPNFQNNLVKESETYGDIVQGDFTDKMDSRTRKGLMGMKWMLTYCSKAKTILKIEQDVFVDTEKLLRGFIPAINQVADTRAMFCYFSQAGQIPRSGPNALSSDIFPNSSKLRPYCKSFAVLMTPATVASLVAASKHVPLCPLEDMFLYGILPYIAGGIQVFDLGNQRAFHDFGKAVVACYQDLQDKCPYVVTKAFSSRFTSLWELVKTRRQTRGAVAFDGQFMWDIKSWQQMF